MSDNDYQSAVGKEVYSIDGANVGHVTELVDQDGKLAFLQVKDSGLFGIGAESFLVPLNAINAVESDRVVVNKSREDLVGIPAHDEKKQSEPGYFSSFFTWWGGVNANE